MMAVPLCATLHFLASAQLLTLQRRSRHLSPNLVFENYLLLNTHHPNLAIPRHLSGVLAVGLRLRALLSWPVTGSAFRRQGAHTENQDPHNDDATPRAFTPHLQMHLIVTNLVSLSFIHSYSVLFANSSCLISREFVGPLHDAWWKGMSP